MNQNEIENLWTLFDKLGPKVIEDYKFVDCKTFYLSPDVYFEVVFTSNDIININLFSTENSECLLLFLHTIKNEIAINYIIDKILENKTEILVMVKTLNNLIPLSRQSIREGKFAAKEII